MWSNGPAIISQLIGCSDSKSRSILGAMLRETRDDCIRVVQILHEGQSLHPLAKPEAWLMAAARGKQRSASERPKLTVAQQAKVDIYAHADRIMNEDVPNYMNHQERSR